jgi:hypothetical protein
MACDCCCDAEAAEVPCHVTSRGGRGVFGSVAIMRLVQGESWRFAVWKGVYRHRHSLKQAADQADANP